jgi:hypothetical protein
LVRSLKPSWQMIAERRRQSLKWQRALVSRKIQGGVALLAETRLAP